MPEVQKTSEGKVQSTWNPWKMFDISQQEMELMKKRKAHAAQKRAEFRRIVNDPAFIVNGGRGGHLVDPAVQRWYSARSTYGEYFRVNKKNTSVALWSYVIPCAVIFYIANKQITERDAMNRRGEIPMKEKCKRAFLFQH